MYVRIWLVLLLSGFCDCVFRQSNIVFQDNGYSNILIAIHDSVTDESIVDKIKTEFTKASKFLHTATRKRAFFKDIVILIPTSWKDGPGITSAAAGQTLQYADIIVSGPRPTHRNYPFTRSYAGCGRSGIHIQMTSDVFLNPKAKPVMNFPEKFIVHEWATFRWGVFNEYPNPGENLFYYSTMFVRADPIRCSIGLKGRIIVRYPNGTGHICDVRKPPDPITGLVEEGCKYFPYPYHNAGTESLMDHQWIKEITDFCDDTHDYGKRKFGHNIEPPNQHNRLCSHRSTWDVIVNTEDFRDNKNQPRNISNLVPTFKVVKATVKRRATVYIDESSHVSNQLADHIIHVLHPTTDIVLRHTDIQTGNHIVKRAAKNGQRITLHNGNSQELYENHSESEHHQIVIGCNHSFKDHNKDNVHAFGCKGEKSPELPNSVFASSPSFQSDSGGPIHIYYKTVHLKVGKILKDSFIVDELLEGRLSVRVTFKDNSSPKVKIDRPGGDSVTDISFDDKLKILDFNDWSPEKGRWTISVSSEHLKDQEISVYIDVIPNSPRNEPITLSGEVSRLNVQGHYRTAVFAHVNQGHHPILGLMVTAILQHTTGIKEQVELYDNGSGADIHQGDGIYSRFLPYHQYIQNSQILVEASDPFHRGYIHNISVLYVEDENVEHDMQYEDSMIPLEHGLSRVTVINPISDGFVTSSTATVLPPARIHDFRSLGMSEDRIITLIFTATGSDLDHGTANHYEMHYAHTSHDIFNHRNSTNLLKRVQQADLIEGILLYPRPSGNIEVLKINATRLGPNKTSFAFIVSAVDKDGNKGEMSNIVTAGL